MQQTLGTIHTPALILDKARLEANLDRMAARASALGVALRPHLKTAKSAGIARLAAMRAPTKGFTVSTLMEAEYFHGAGFSDLLYAVAIEPGKFARAAALLKAGADLTVCCDSVAVARALADSGAGPGVRFPVLIEVDSGEHRSGVAPTGRDVTEIGRLLHEGAGAVLRGVCTHGGHSYGGRTPTDHNAVAREECEAVVAAADALKGAGLPCPVVSVGSTPTALFAGQLTGVTELRCGVYMFGDLFQAGIGSCRQGEIAVSVLAAVIGHRPELNMFLVDAGGLALSKDISTAKLTGEANAGYGLVCDLEGRVVPGLKVTTVHQEHGHVTSGAPIDLARFPIGSRVRILPNHSCMTAAAYDRYHVVDELGAIQAEWPRVNGW